MQTTPDLSGYKSAGAASAMAETLLRFFKTPLNNLYKLILSTENFTN